MASWNHREEILATIVGLLSATRSRCGARLKSRSRKDLAPANGQVLVEYGLALAVIAGLSIFVARQVRDWVHTLPAGVGDAIIESGRYF